MSEKIQVLIELSHFSRDSDFCFWACVAGTVGDTDQEPDRSVIRVLEDGMLLGPPHVDHDEIRQKGEGRYSHWGETLYFSTSDNSDPNTNGRRYTLWLPPISARLLRYRPRGRQEWGRAESREEVRREQVLFEIDQFKRYCGHSFVVELPGSNGDCDERPHQSTLQVLENGVLIGPPHVNHDEIQQEGAGRYSHWGETLYFSTSDNSDPNTNGRRYTLWLPPISARPLRYRPPGRQEWGRAESREEVRREQVLFEIDQFKRYCRHSFVVELPGSNGDCDERPHQSTLQVLENGVLIGPPHVNHDEIQQEGAGRYSHWGEELYFSTSDNSDPDTNGRRYHICTAGLTPAFSPTILIKPPPDRAREPPSIHIQRLTRPFSPAGAAAFIAVLDYPVAPQDVVYLAEDGVFIGQRGATHRQIRLEHGGRYDIFDGKIFFSASDGSNCNANGREYQIVVLNGTRFRADAAQWLSNDDEAVLNIIARNGAGNDNRIIRNFLTQYKIIHDFFKEIGKPLPSIIAEIGSGRYPYTGLRFLLEGTQTYVANDILTVNTAFLPSFIEALRDACTALDLTITRSFEKIFIPDGGFYSAKGLTTFSGTAFEDLSFNGPVDFVHSTSVLEHVMAPERVAEKMADILPPDTLMYHFIDFRDHRDFRAPFDFLSLTEAEYAPIATENRLRPSDWMDILERNGFEIIRRRNEAMSRESVLAGHSHRDCTYRFYDRTEPLLPSVTEKERDGFAEPYRSKDLVDLSITCMQLLCRKR